MNNIETLNPQIRDIHLATRFLTKAGFNVTIAEPEEYPMVKFQTGGYVVCGDGREMVDPTTGQMVDKMPAGPAVFGGFEGFRWLLGHGDQKGAKKAVSSLEEEGLQSTIHGDENEGENGCGAIKKVNQGLIRLPHQLELVNSLKDDFLVKRIKYVVARLNHAEKLFVINLEEGYSTKRALDGSTFRFDPRILTKHGVSLAATLNYGISTVTNLSPCREAILVAAR